MLGLHAVAEGQSKLVGGKAANLARMLQAGLPVPPGFCVTTAAFDEFVATCPRREALLETLARLPAGSAADFTVAGRRVTACLVNLPVPPAVEAAVLQAWREWGGREPTAERRRCAVRSSATVEDAADHSFAGQFDSFLNVDGPEALLAAVRDCWLSLFSERALAYQARHGWPAEPTAMAVVVQGMIPADVAGVLFTSDPLDGNPERMLIEGTPGLGDRLVSGQVEPQRVALDKATLEVVPAPASGVGWSLTPVETRRLGELAREVERLFGGPQDIEWAVASGRVFLLQARPITVRRPAGSRGAHDALPNTSGDLKAGTWEDRQVWSNLNAGEVAPDVMTPMTWSLIQQFLAQLARPVFRLLGADPQRAPSVGLIGGRIYFNVNTGLAAARPFGLLLWRIPNAARVLGGGQIALHENGTLNLRAEDLPDLGFRWPKYVLSWPRVLYDLITHSPRQGDRWTAGLKAAQDPLAAVDLGALSATELARLFERLLHRGFKGWDLLYLVTQASALPVFQWVCHRWLDDPDFALGYRLFAALGGLPEIEAVLTLWRLAALAHTDPATEAVLAGADGWATVRTRLTATETGRSFLAAWEVFMAEHGHHCRGELELFNARWAERPDYILGLVRSYLKGLEGADPLESQRRLGREREELTAQCQQRLKNPCKRWVFSRSLRRAQRLATNREEWKNQAIRHIARLRRVLLMLGERVCQEGRLARPDDVFFLEVTEVGQVASGQSPGVIATVVADRRARYEKHLALNPPPVVIGRFDPGAQRPAESHADVKVLKGIPVFPGVVSGPARVILRADDHEYVQPGEILVAPFTDPAWTPYFLPAAGVVMDLGGILSHGSIIAREYGLPAVTNLGTASEVIRTGDLVQVDGGRGEVTILERAAARSKDSPR